MNRKRVASVPVDFKGRYVEVRGTRLYVYDIGDAAAPALLYLHGGPGMGCHEFVRWQGRALASGGVRLIAFDQRGFHHSDPIGADESLSEDVLVEDCEALRDALGLASWFVLGHSYGGRLATRYAARYPERVRGVIFENPAWSVESTQRYRMPVFAAIYERHGRPQEARACRALAARPDIFADDPLRVDLIGGISRLGEAWYLYDRSDTGFLDAVALESPHPEADDAAAAGLRNDPLNSEDLRPLLAGLAGVAEPAGLAEPAWPAEPAGPEGLAMPAQLIIGEADLVTSPDQIESFAAVFGAGSVQKVDEAGHFVQGEQPETYAKLVLEFVNAREPTSSDDDQR